MSAIPTEANNPGHAAPAPRPQLHDAVWPPKVPRTVDVPDTSLWFNLEVSARRYPNKTAYHFFGRRITYRELKTLAESLAGWLQQRAGVKQGDRVLVMFQNSPQYVAAFYAVLRCGAAVVPVNPMSRADELAHYIADPSAKVAICASDLYPHIIAGNEQLEPGQRLSHILVGRYTDLMPAEPVEGESPPDAWMSWLDAAPTLQAGATWWSDAVAMQLVPAAVDTSADDLAAVCYTSGTTGKPKGCMHTHRTIGHNVVAGAVWTHSSGSDVSLGVVPAFHITGMLYVMHIPIWQGSSVVVMPRWDRELAGRLISRLRVTTWTNIPTMVIDLLASPNISKFDLSSLRQIGGGGAAMPQAVAERLEAQFGLKYMEGYGLTETAAPTHSNPTNAPKRQCLGIPFIGTDARVVDPNTLQEVAQGQIGEIVINGPQVFKGYWGRPQETAAAFFELEGKSFFRTGDLGYVDPEGYFFITDRLKRMINASGFKVWPAEVETMLFRHPAVQEACVIGTRDPYRGETVKAVIVLRPEAVGNTTAADIQSWAREHMAAYKVPQLVDFVDALPKSGSGKVMWRQLQEAEKAS